MEKENVIIKSANVLSNSIVSKVSDNFLFEDVKSAGNEKDAKKSVANFVKSIKDSKDLANPIVFAMRAKVAADIEYQKQISEHICQASGADVVVSNILSEIGKPTENESSTPES